MFYAHTQTVSFNVFDLELQMRHQPQRVSECDDVFFFFAQYVRRFSMIVVVAVGCVSNRAPSLTRLLYVPNGETSR